MPLALRKRACLSSFWAWGFSKKLTPTIGRHSNMSARYNSASASSASDSEGACGVFALSNSQRLASSARRTSCASRYWTWALFRFWSLLLKATAWVQKSFFFEWLSIRSNNVSPSPTYVRGNSPDSLGPQRIYTPVRFNSSKARTSE